MALQLISGVKSRQLFRRLNPLMALQLITIRVRISHCTGLRVLENKCSSQQVITMALQLITIVPPGPLCTCILLLGVCVHLLLQGLECLYTTGLQYLLLRRHQTRQYQNQFVLQWSKLLNESFPRRSLFLPIY